MTRNVDTRFVALFKSATHYNRVRGSGANLAIVYEANGAKDPLVRTIAGRMLRNIRRRAA
ncbi:hypothetical protein [Cupriavidus sp. DL-D2]|uniref:hypothetical protein n=1 Tax=Cupriavidus sp. DL-D2 TaxID=3144974 RepID=UPI0032151BFA